MPTSGELEVTNHHHPGPGRDRNKHRSSHTPAGGIRRVLPPECLQPPGKLAADPGLAFRCGDLCWYRMWNAMYHSQGVLGGAIWAGIDDTFFLPGEQAVGYGTWGPIDGWRREKPEYWGMKKAFSPVKIVQKGNMSADGIVRFHVENRHNFSNLSECFIVWKAGGGKSGRVTTDMAPRSEGEFEIQLPESLRNTEKLELSGYRCPWFCDR